MLNMTVKSMALFLHFVVNKAKGRISKRVFQENKARQIFRKTNIFTPWYAHVRIRGYKMFVFRKIWRVLLSWNTSFEIRPSTLLPTIIFASLKQVELVALEPELKQKSLDTEKLMERLQIDQEEADQVKLFLSAFNAIRESAT